MRRIISLFLRSLSIYSLRRQKNKVIWTLRMYILYVHNNVHHVMQHGEDIALARLIFY
jgi:hypothetical protein